MRRDYDECDACGGLRLNERALSATVDGVGIGEADMMLLREIAGAGLGEAKNLGAQR